MKSRDGKSQRREETKKEYQKRESFRRKKEDPGARRGRKIAKHCVFPMICSSGGSKSRLAKAAGAEPAGQMRDEKLHAVVARSAFPSQNVPRPSNDTFICVAILFCSCCRFSPVCKKNCSFAEKMLEGVHAFPIVSWICYSFWICGFFAQIFARTSVASKQTIPVFSRARVAKRK